MREPSIEPGARRMRGRGAELGHCILPAPFLHSPSPVKPRNRRYRLRHSGWRSSQGQTLLIGNFLTHEERQLAGLTQVDARVTGRTDPDAPLKQWGDEGPRPARVDTPDPKLCPNIASIKQRTSPPATDTQRSLRSERGTPRSAPMHHLQTHARQGMADDWIHRPAGPKLLPQRSSAPPFPILAVPAVIEQRR